MLGLVTQALANGYQVTLLHYSRSKLPQLQRQWQQLSDTYPAFSYHFIHTEPILLGVTMTLATI
ncbi:MAG: hypothetical protein VX408_07435 [Pseudomonadota bacterium]|nr:hypothetical protein [Pseudomonadota bacterium]MED6318187.1 hypothetical protein [Pseudomonadota bacterium]